MRHGSLFSGIGGFDLAAEWMGWTNVFHCEWMEFPRKVLDYHFPDADSHIDICKTDFKKYANTIDILTGGFPCQPFSTAGKRKGTDDERYLWGEMLRAIQEIKPRFVIAENVFGITNIDGGLVFEQVCLDLENEGYEVQPFIIPACSKNAPHRRDRCWFIAQNPLFGGCVHGESHQERTKIREFGNTCTRSADGIYLSKGNATNTNRDGRSQQWRYDRSGQINARSNAPFKWSANTKKFDNGNTSANFSGKSVIDSGIGKQANVETNQLANAEGICRMDKECDKCKGIISNDRCENVNCRALVQDGREWIQPSKHRGMDKDCGDISSDGTNECKNDGTIINRLGGVATDTIGIRYRGSSEKERSNISGCKWELEKNIGQHGNKVRSKIKRHRTHIGGIYWENFPTQSPICSGDDGIPTELDGITFPKWRAESIKGYGNAIVPQIAYQLFQIINEL
jgi:DNA-cytosine methyltransferase